MKGVLRRRYLVVVAGDAAQARQMTTGIRGVATLAAISDSAVREQGPADRVVAGRLAAAARRLAVVRAARRRRAPARGRARAHPRRARRADVGAHAGLARRGDRAVRLRRPPGRATPRATWPATPAASRAGPLTLTGLSSPGAIGRLDGEGQSAAYAYSSAAAFYIAERFGRKRYLRLYDAFNDPKLTEPEGAELTAAAVRKTLGISLLELERDLRRWIVTRAVVEPFAP